jgi:hypothetical protein
VRGQRPRRHSQGFEKSFLTTFKNVEWPKSSISAEKGFLSDNCAERKLFYETPAENEVFGISKFFGFQTPFFKKGFGRGAGAAPPQTFARERSSRGSGVLGGFALGTP